MARPEVDPITLQVISGALDTIAEEMGHILYRMSFSSIIRESQDLGAGLFDIDFNTLCESESTPLHIGSLPGYLEGIAETLQGGEWEDGDVVIHNHPYYGSSHSPDIAIVIPVFHRGKLVAFSANTAHHLDIGAATPGLIIDIPDVFAEGMLFAGTKLYQRGERNEALWDYIGRNSRAARQLQDDLDAQIASARLGVRRFGELLDRYGEDMVLAATHQLMDYTERVLRQRIETIPDGEYRAEGFLDDDGRNRDVRLPIKVCVRVQGNGIQVDLTGSADQVETGFNVPFEGSTKVACFCAVRSLLLDAETSEVKVPSNQGSFRPIEVIAPKGSIFNPIYPAAAEARFSQCNRVIDLIYKALAPVLPNDIIAGSSASLSFAAYSGIRPSGDYWVFLEVNEGAYGARPASDGPDSIDNLMANTRNNPLEDLAIHLPMVCDRYELRDDVMPGAGRFRGGIGVVKKQRMLTGGFITHESERHTDVPWGIFGGTTGQCGGLEIYNAANPDQITVMPAKFSGLRVNAGDVMAFYGPCGGGYGDPLERPPEQVLEDVLDEFCTLDHARQAYGVVVDLEREVVDVAATEALRSKLRAAPKDPRIGEPPGIANPTGTATDVPSFDASRSSPPVASTVPLPAKPTRAKPESERSLTVKHPSKLSSDEPDSGITDLVGQLNSRFGADWSFDVLRHRRNGAGIEVEAELKANGTRVQRSASAHGAASLGTRLAQAADAAFQRCALEVLTDRSAPR